MSQEFTDIVGDRFLSFSLGQEEFGVPLLDVKEVIALPEVTPVPHTPPYFLGMMNLRGQVVSVLDLRKKFSIKSEETDETCVIICDFDGLVLGVVVDSVDSVIAPKEAELSEKPAIESKLATEFIRCVFRREESLVLLIDLAKVLNADDLKRIAQAKAAA